MYTRSVPKMYVGLLGMFMRRARLLVVPSAICTLGVFRRCTQGCWEFSGGPHDCQEYSGDEQG